MAHPMDLLEPDLFEQVLHNCLVKQGSIQPTVRLLHPRGRLPFLQKQRSVPLETAVPPHPWADTGQPTADSSDLSPRQLQTSGGDIAAGHPCIVSRARWAVLLRTCSRLH